MKIPIITLYLVSLLVISCSERPKPPTDEEMVEHFSSYQSRDEEDIPLYGLPKLARIQLDSLLTEISCGFVQVDHYKRGKSGIVDVCLVIPFYSSSVVDDVTSKCFVYDTGLRKRSNIHITERGGT